MKKERKSCLSMKMIDSSPTYSQYYRGLGLCYSTALPLLADVACTEISQQEGAPVLIVWKRSTSPPRSLKTTQPQV